MKIGDIRKTTVIGAGIMGAQIAEVLSRMGGYEVGMVDINDDLVKKGFQLIEGRLDRFFVSILHEGILADGEECVRS